MYIIATILAISFLIIVHEFGHLLMAKWRGVKVNVFSLGMGPTIYETGDKFKTNYKVAPFLLGGYVKLEETGPNSMETASTVDKLYIFIGGVLMNIISAIIFLAIVLSIWGQYGIEYSYNDLTFTEANVEYIDDSTIHLIAEDVTIKLGEGNITSKIVFTRVKYSNIPKIIVTTISDDTKSVIKVLSGLLNGKQSTDDVMSIIGVGVILVDILKVSKGMFIYMLYVLSLNLAFFNILPIPALDGGQILFLFLDKLFFFIKEEKRKLIGNTVQVGFFIILLSVGVFFMYKDIVRMIG